MNSDVRVGERYEHPCGLVVRVIDQRVPGDRDDELRVWCEVVVPAHAGDVAYEAGDRDGWNLLPIEGWKRKDA